MKAVAYYRYGGPEVMQLADLPQPTLRPGHALVKIEAASINPVDWKLRGGLLRLIMGKKFPRLWAPICRDHSSDRRRQRLEAG